MSNILKGTDIKYFENLILSNQLDCLSEDVLEDILKNILPKNGDGKVLIKYRLPKKFGTAGKFIPSGAFLEVNVSKLNDWLKMNTDSLAEYYNIHERELLRKYLILFVLTHEIEHSYQYLIAKEKLEAPCKLVQQGYNSLLDLMEKKDYILPRPILLVRRAVSLSCYKAHENEFVLERNANIEGLDLLCKLSFKLNHLQINQMFKDMFNIFAYAGYHDDCFGSFNQTYKNIHMYDKYCKFDFDFELSLDERVRFGLEIDEKTRNELKLLVKGSKKKV